MTKDRSRSEFENIGAILGVSSRAVIPTETKNAQQLQAPAQTDFDNRQLSLFQTFLANNDEQQDALSNAIDLWDSVPRYSVSRQAMTKARIDGEFLRNHEMSFQHRGHTYTRIISPARVKDLDGKNRDFYPSASEELTEDALRKLAIEQQAGYFDRTNFSSGVVFTLYQLREELRKRGHARSYQEIVQSLDILSHCIVEIKPHADGEGKIVAPCLPSLAAVSREKLSKDPKARWMVQFHPLVTGSIDQVTYRQYNYALMMGHSSQLARWVHKQLVIKYTFAEYMKPFDMRYSTVRRDSGLLSEYARARKAIEMLDEAFDELKTRAVFQNYKREEVIGPRGKVLDVVYTVQPNYEFVKEVKAANKRQGDGAKPVGIGGGSRQVGRYRGRVKAPKRLFTTPSRLLSFYPLLITFLLPVLRTNSRKQQSSGTPKIKTRSHGRGVWKSIDCRLWWSI